MIRVIEPGFYSSVQDTGRFGYRQYGVPISGTADLVSAERVNAMLENHPKDALLEMTMQGAILEFTAPTSICLGGAPMDISLDGEPLERNRVYEVHSNQVLSCGRIHKGLRTYLGLRGGLQTPEMLGSRSYFKSITGSAAVKAGDLLPFHPAENFQPKILKWSHPEHLDKKVLGCSPGPEFTRFGEALKEQVFDKTFTISNAFNRMGCQLDECIQGHSQSMITSATLPGTVQLTPSGKIIILLCDGQTTGGYPRILQLSDEAISILAQKRFGDEVIFESLDVV